MLENFDFFIVALAPTLWSAQNLLKKQFHPNQAHMKFEREYAPLPYLGLHCVVIGMPLVIMCVVHASLRYALDSIVHALEEILYLCFW